MSKKINKYLDTRYLGREILHFKQCDSTNRIAKELGKSHGAMIIADSQTAGRGRRGREWQSEKGGIYMSVILSPEGKENISEITLLCAVALIRAIGTGGIKWPNDIVIDGKKVAGILCERTDDAVICGVGINISNSLSPQLYATKLTGVNPTKLVAGFLNELETILDKGFMSVHDEYLSHCINIDNEVMAIYENKTVTGTAIDVTPTGELVISTADGDISVNSGEVSIRGVYGYI